MNREAGGRRTAPARRPVADRGLETLGDRGLYELIFDNSYDGIYVVDNQRKILMWNRSAERISGYSADEVAGRFCHDNILQHQDAAGSLLCHVGCPLERAMETATPGAARVTLLRKDGKRLPVDVSVAPMFGEDGQVVGAVEVFRDASAYKRLEAASLRITRLIYKDYLTGVSNRREAARILEHEIRQAQRYGIALSVAMMDLDDFKRINDAQGHAAGDAALKKLASVLKRAARDADAVGRWGGDEFIVIAPFTTSDGLDALAERVRLRVENAASRSPGAMTTASIGIAELNDGDADSKDLLARADHALYEAKRAGGNRVVVG